MLLILEVMYALLRLFQNQLLTLPLEYRSFREIDGERRRNSANLMSKTIMFSRSPRPRRVRFHNKKNNNNNKLKKKKYGVVVFVKNVH